MSRTTAGDPPSRDDVPFEVVASRHPTPVIAELELSPAGAGIDYRAGQYVLVGDEDYARPVRSYSLANPPRPDGSVTLLVTRVPGGEVSTWLHRVAVGERLLLSGPYGTFVDDVHEPGPRLYLAGGSGLAPVRALIEAALARPAPPPMTLLFSARSSADLIDDERLCGWDRQHERFRYLRTLTRAGGPPPVGHVPDVLAGLLPRLDHYRVYIAGGSGFVASCEAAVRAHGAVAERVFTEEFFLDPRPWGAATVTTATEA